MEKSHLQKLKSNESLNPAWNASNLFYTYLANLDMDFSDAFYDDDYKKMDKISLLKYMKIKEFIIEKATKKDLEIIEDVILIKNLLKELKQPNSDYINRFNNQIVSNVIDVVMGKMMLMEKLMSKSGMNLLLKIKDFKPAALGGDDF